MSISNWFGLKNINLFKFNHSLLGESTITIIGKPFIKLNLVDSTNNYAMQQVKNGIAKHGTAYFSYEQTAGKGQRNKQWLSCKGENIILSIVLEANQFFVEQKFFLNVITALCVKNLFNKYTTDKIEIKWPNDIYWCDRKAAGILVENIVAGNKIQCSIAGFGVNINQTQFDVMLKNPVSLKQITGKNYDVIKLAKELCLMLQDKYVQLMNNDVEALMNEYNQYLYKRDLMIKFKKDDAVFEGCVLAVDDIGRLIIKTETESVFEFGSIDWIIE